LSRRRERAPQSRGCNSQRSSPHRHAWESWNELPGTKTGRRGLH